MHTHILIATDGSALAEKAVRAGVDLAKASGAKVTIVTVSEAFPAYDLGTKLGLFRDQAAGILETARARGCDLIVLTSNGRQGLERFIMGSQAARVAQGAETSVLIVR